MDWTVPTPTGLRNIHRRTVSGPIERAGALLDALGSPEDRLWPSDRWHPMVLSDKHARGSHGGHGSVRYEVVESAPGRSVTFAFRGDGLQGTHRFEVTEDPEGVRWQHVLDLESPSWVTRRLVLPLHDALLEDLLDRAEALAAGRTPRPARHSWPVRWRRAVSSLVETPPEPPPVRRRRARVGALTAAGIAGVAAIHLAWAFGVTWPASSPAELARAVLGSPEATAMPAPVMTAAIAAALVVAGAAVLARGAGSGAWRAAGHLGTALVAGVLALRGVAGLAQSLLAPDTVTELYRVLDLAVYSPLCLVLAAGLLVARGSLRLDRPPGTAAALG